MTATRPRPPSARPGAAPGEGPAAWRAWTALWIVYVVWGSTYLGIAVMVETVPPLLGGAARFTLAGGLLLALLATRRPVRPTRAELLSALLVGGLLMGANGILAIAEKTVPSGLAALLIASIPLWVIVLRMAARKPVSRRSLGAVLVGFLGVALMLRPGGQSGEATVVGLLACVAAAAIWAAGSFASPRIRLPRDPLVSTGWQMVCGGLVLTVLGLATGEAGDVHLDRFSTRSIVAFAYLVVFGSWVAFTAYSWLLQNVPISKVSTYAYVNPVVAIVLGWLVLDEAVTGVTLLGAAIIVASVALVIRIEQGGRR